MNKFESIKVNNVLNLTDEAVMITFDTSSSNNFKYYPGQYITIKQNISGEEIRRAYSICSSVNEKLSIGVKRVYDGKMSTFLTKQVKKGDILEVLPPNGNFLLTSDSKLNIAICAGSGITPILSMIKSSLIEHSDVKFELIYGNKTRKSTMFLDELIMLEKKYNDRFKIHWFYSQERVDTFSNSRIDKDNLQNLLNMFPNMKNADSYFLCGPGGLIDNSKELLLLNQVKESNIYFERFNVDTNSSDSNSNSDEIISNVTVCVDGDDFDFSLSSTGQTILDAAMENGADVPFSCKGAVCCTCKGKVIKGKVTMDANYSLSDEEVREGYILGCQARPASLDVIVDFDEV